MNIVELTDADKAEFQNFKKTEWRIADIEHYGDNPPDFEKTTFALIAKEGGQIIGQVKVDVNQGVAKIDSLLVGKAHQGKGIGRQLMIEAENKATELGAHKITLETGSEWAAKPFYEKLGYSVRATLPNDVAHQEFVLMDKMLG